MRFNVYLYKDLKVAVASSVDLFSVWRVNNM